MKACELMEELYSLGTQRVQDSVDTLKAGDPQREVHKVGVCFIATPQVIESAAEWGADLLITHEPTYYDHRDLRAATEGDPVAAAKHKLIEQSGFSIYRYHDNIHMIEPRVFEAAIWEKVGFEGEHIDAFRFRLSKALTPRHIAELLKEKLGVDCVRAAGAIDAEMSVIILAEGSPGDDATFTAIRDSEAGCLLCGEVTEWKVCEYARDAAQLGFAKAVLAFGHVGSERDGMERLSHMLTHSHPELETRYFECGEVYKAI